LEIRKIDQIKLVILIFHRETGSETRISQIFHLMGTITFNEIVTKPNPHKNLWGEIEEIGCQDQQ